MAKVIYTGLFLSPESKAALLAAFPAVHSKTFAEHVTLCFRPNPMQLTLLEPLVGESFEVIVTAHAADEFGQAAALEVPEALRVDPGQLMHATISCADGVAPKYSKELLARGGASAPANALKLTGTVRHFTGGVA